MSKESNANAARRSRARQRARLMAEDPARISDAMLRRITFDHAVLTKDEEVLLETEIDEAKRELYRRRGGADRELQLAHDFGRIDE